MAIAALILGIIAIPTAFAVFGAVFGVVALVLGFLGLGKAKQTGSGKGLAVGGIVLGIISLLIAAIIVIFVGSVVKHVSDLGTCLNNAGSDTAAQQSCQDRFGFGNLFSPQPSP